MSLPIIGWLDEIITDAFKSVFKGINEQSDDYIRSLDIFKKGRKRYFDFIIDRHGKVQILGMTRPTALADMFVSVRVNQQIETKRYIDLDAFNRNEAAYLRKLAKDRAKMSENPIQAFDKYHRITLLGKPGCGKTTLLKYFALLYSGVTVHTSYKPSRKSARIPFVVLLREFQEKNETLFKYMTNILVNCGFSNAEQFLTNLLQNGHAIIMLDGLDEVDARKAKKIHDEVFELIARYPDCKYILSCRTAAYKDNYEGFVELEIEDFRPIQQFKFIEAWFKKDVEKGKRLIKLVKALPQLSELAKNPLLISLLCILYKRTLDIPKNRVELYEECMRTMLTEWDSSRNFRRETKYENLSDYKKIKLFNYLAYTFLSQDQRIFHRRDIVKFISEYVPKFGIGIDESVGILEEIASHHGIILPISTNSYCFSHLTFQEYCSASYLVDTRQENWLLNRLNNMKWLEVFSMTASLLEDASPFITGILEVLTPNRFQRLCIAAYCISNEASISEDLKKHIITSLLNEITNAGSTVRRIYVTHPGKNIARHALFFEGVTRDKKGPTKIEKDKMIRFMSAINCLYFIFNTSFLRELQTYLKNPAYGRNVKIFDHMLKSKENKETLIVYSNVLHAGGLELPMEVTNFETRIGGLLDNQWVFLNNIEGPTRA